ncbi:MAG: hypothetical protein TQ37_04930 [Candidatus Synechococcus spongiarum 15L]|uniref:Uncharacterized protein n=1 Tax=Candidatus Synechococcus spongiarum 15L TaxID=1608419 RepID=A0A0G8AVY8_9SYNE|nr:MAG: hypothetical protein TQ37_04930 [Candidatus Synechococcus spongiarum 15L]
MFSGQLTTHFQVNSFVSSSASEEWLIVLFFLRSFLIEPLFADFFFCIFESIGIYRLDSFYGLSIATQFFCMAQGKRAFKTSRLGWAVIVEQKGVSWDGARWTHFCVGTDNQVPHQNQGVNDIGFPGGIAPIECDSRQGVLLDPWHREDRSSPVFRHDPLGGSQEQFLSVADGAVVLHSEAEEHGSSHQAWLI